MDYITVPPRLKSRKITDLRKYEIGKITDLQRFES